MDASQAHPVQAVLRHWLHERHQALLEQVMMTWEEGLGRLNPGKDLLEQILEAAGPARDDGAALDKAMDLLEAAASQGEVLHRLLDALGPFADRCALFILKQGMATLFAQRGFEGDPPKTSGSVAPPAELEALIQGRSETLAKAGEAYTALLGPLSTFQASDLRVLALRLKRKAVALLLVDSGHRQRLEAVGPIRAVAHSAEACLAHLAGAKEEERTGTMPMPVQPPPSAPTQQLQGTTQAVPAPVADDLDPKVRATAERLARVLVGDIELYFPQKVAQGRQGGTLYALLREELERSRATFIDRFGQEVETRHRIFFRTLVDLLCEGDPGKLKGAPWAP